MCIQIKNREGNPIIEISIWVNTSGQYEFVAIDSTVDVREYSTLLLTENDREKQNEIVDDFEFFDVSVINHWLDKDFFKGGMNDPSKYDEVIDALGKKINAIGDKYNLVCAYESEM